MSELEDRINKRKRQKVQARGSVLENLVPNKELVEEVSSSVGSEPIYTENASLERGEEEQLTYQNFELAQATLRLEKNIAQRLQALCISADANLKVSREAFIEAMFIDLEANPEHLLSVIEMAKERTRLRKRVANWKRGRSIARNAGIKTI